MTRKNQIRLFILSIFVHLFYYISAFYTHTLTPFFVHVTPGQDFFQIPNAAYAFLHGGTLTGILPKGSVPYISCCGVNANVYHPLFTLLIGAPLQFFPPWTAFGLWVIIHLIVTAVLVYYLRRQFRNHKYIYLALALYLFNSYHYYEIWHAQYHFLFVFFSVLFLVEVLQKNDTKKAGFWLFLSLLVKPIGLLWILPLLLYKRFKTVGVGLGSFVFVTGAFSLFPFGQYYLRNFFAVSTAIFPTHNLYSIHYLLPSFPLVDIKDISIVIAGLLFVYQLTKRPNLFTVLLLWTGFQLLFYPLVYHYQYTVMAGFICLGCLFNVFSPKMKVMAPILFLTLPAPVILFHLFGDPVTARPELSVIFLYSAFWLIILLMFTVYSQWCRKTEPAQKE